MGWTLLAMKLDGYIVEYRHGGERSGEKRIPVVKNGEDLLRGNSYLEVSSGRDTKQGNGDGK